MRTEEAKLRVLNREMFRKDLEARINHAKDVQGKMANTFTDKGSYAILSTLRQMRCEVNVLHKGVYAESAKECLDKLVDGGMSLDEATDKTMLWYKSVLTEDLMSFNIPASTNQFANSVDSEKFDAIKDLLRYDVRV